MNKNPCYNYELMAPIGAYDSLSAALFAGANSVYFGVGKLNMRVMSSQTFTIEDMHNIVSMCRDKGVKPYLTLNSIIYDNEIDEMKAIVDSACQAGVVAIIAHDMAVLDYCKKNNMEIHLSTQANVSNIEALKFYSQYADVIVLARELTLEQVKKINSIIENKSIIGPKGNKVKIEMFCHGALCMAVSGKCYLSLHEAWRSANRGACVQICRRSYTARDNETDRELSLDNKYIMSPKDLKTIRFIDKMLQAGVKVFKIEGRARGPEYVKTVVECYREALDSVQTGTFSEEKKDAWDKKLSTVFNRGFWDGWYLGQKIGDWNKRYGSSATEKKVYVGKAVKYYGRIGVAEFKIEAAEFLPGDKLLITGPTTGAIYLTPLEVHGDNGKVDIVKQGMLAGIAVDKKVRPGDKLFKIIISSFDETES